jgi:tetratricopeptide (TPR) repeat protein
MQNGKPEDALALMHQGLALARQQGERYTAGALLFNIAAITWEGEGPTDECERCYWEAAKLRRELGEQVSYANILSQVANIPLWRDGDVSTPLPALAEALAIAEEQDVPGTRAHVLAEMTTHRLVAGDYQEALALTDEVLSLASSHRGTWTWASMQHGIALLALGDIDTGLSFMKRSLTRMVEKHWKSFIGIFLPFLGIVLARRGEYEQATELLALGFSQLYTGRLDIDPLITQFRCEMERAVGEERFAILWERGRDLEVLSVANDVLRKLNS